MLGRTGARAAHARGRRACRRTGASRHRPLVSSASLTRIAAPAQGRAAVPRAGAAWLSATPAQALSGRRTMPRLPGRTARRTAGIVHAPKKKENGEEKEKKNGKEKKRGCNSRPPPQRPPVLVRLQPASSTAPLGRLAAEPCRLPCCCTDAPLGRRATAPCRPPRRRAAAPLVSRCRLGIPPCHTWHVQGQRERKVKEEGKKQKNRKEFGDFA